MFTRSLKFLRTVDLKAIIAKATPEDFKRLRRRVDLRVLPRRSTLPRLPAARCLRFFHHSPHCDLFTVTSFFLCIWTVVVTPLTDDWVQAERRQIDALFCSGIHASNGPASRRKAVFLAVLLVL